MVCANCQENLERIELGYSPQNLPCTCSVKESFVYNVKQVLIGLPLLFLVFLTALILAPFCWESDRIEENTIRGSYDEE